MEHDRKLHLVGSKREETPLSGELRHENQPEPEMISTVLYIPLDSIAVSPFQTRELVEDDELHELKESISSTGVIQPITVRKRPVAELADDEPSADDNGSSEEYELVAGERRFRAARLAGLTAIPALVRSLSDEESIRISVIENAQRANLNPVEEALAYEMLVRRFRLTHADVAKAVGKSRVAIANSLRLLNLDPNVIELLKCGDLTAGHGRALLMLESRPLQARVGRRAARKGYSVRVLEQLVTQLNERLAKGKTSGRAARELDLERKNRQRTQERVAEILGVERVRLAADTEGRRRITITFDTDSAWKRFMSRIKD